jgi:hypothetical protein
MDLLERIERHIASVGKSATRFGRDFAHDPRLILDLRKGRRPRRALRARITSYLDTIERPGCYQAGAPASADQAARTLET